MKKPSADELWARARQAPLPTFDHPGTWRRLTAPRRPSWGVRASFGMAVVSLFVFFAWSETAQLNSGPLLAGSAVHAHAPRFVSQRLVAAMQTAQRVEKLAPRAPAPVRDEAPESIPPAAVQAPLPPAQRLVEVPAQPLPSGPARVATYQPRAIVEFRHIDWQRWQGQALPQAVAELVRHKDTKGLLAALDALPLRSDGSPLLMLRGQLRAQAQRCEDARADLVALGEVPPHDLAMVCAP